MTAVGALVAACLCAVASGCAFDSQIAAQFLPTSPAVVKESFNPEQSPDRVQGVTTRKGQVVKIDCSVTVVYDVSEATGSAVLVQRYVAHLRTRRVPRGTAYELDCAGPVIVEIPADASGVQATATDADGRQTALPVQVPVKSVPLASGKRLRAEPQTQLAVVSWPDTLSGDYRVELSFALPEPRAIREKVLSTASVSCGRSMYLQPILPPVTTMERVPAFTIRPSAGAIAFSVPRVAGGAGSYAERTRTLSCGS